MADVKVRITAEDAGSANVQKFGVNLGGLAAKAVAADAALNILRRGFGVLQSAASAAFAALNEGAQLELAQSRFENLAASIGTTADALQNDMVAATQGLISNAQLVASASDMISLGLADSGDEVVRLSNLVGQLGWDMQTLTLTMANDSMMRLDALGLSVENVTARMEGLKAAGMSADEAFDMAVIEAGEDKLKLLGSAADSTAGQIQKLTVIWQNATDAFKVEFAEGVADQLAAVTAVAGQAGPAIQEGLGQWGETAGGWIGNLIAGAAAEGLQRGTDDIKRQLRDMGVSRQELAELERQATERPLPFIYDATEGIRYYTDLNDALRQQYGLLLDLQNLNQRDDRDVAEREAMERAAAGEAGAVRDLTDAYVDVTAQYWQAEEGARTFYGSFEYGEMVIAQQAAAVDNLAARTEAYAALVERYRQTMADSGDFFMAQAGAENPIFGPDMAANGDALNDLILSIADNAGVGALGLADLNIQLGEMEPAAARAMVAASVAGQAIEILMAAWQGGKIDTAGLMGSIDAVISELQNKTLPDIEIGIKAKIDLANAADIPHGERAWMDMMGESPVIPVEANLSPFEEALGQALGQITGAPDSDRTLQILADYEAVTNAASSEIPAAIQGIPADARTVAFIPDTAQVLAALAEFDGKHITIYVDYVNTGDPAPARAAGGPVTGHAPYFVGEAGPELFVPWTNGTIIPNHRLGLAGGAEISMTVNFYGQTDAGDARRAVQSAGERLIERIRQAGVAV